MELLVAIIVLALLAALAMPSFFDSVRKSHRSEAFVALTHLQHAQERWRTNHAEYSADLAELGVASSTTANGYYTLSVVAASATGYTLKAVAGGSQASDTACATMALSATGGTLRYGSACSGCALSDPLSDTGRCWNRQ